MVASSFLLLALASAGTVTANLHNGKRMHHYGVRAEPSDAVAGSSRTTERPASTARGDASRTRDDSTRTAAPTSVSAQVAAASASGSPLPLTKYKFAYDELPYQVNPFPVGRGPQSGTNICNSTTAGPSSQCQTLIFNSIDDFCLWGAPETTPTGTVGDNEAAAVVYCTKDTHGARTLPAGAISALQFMRTSAYIQVTGFISNEALNLMATDTGGELDPHGADLLGNPLGGLVYSSGLPSRKDNTSLIQVIEWNSFIGGNQFCFKVCDPTVTSPNYCENHMDLLGCAYNMPASYTPNQFTDCEGDLQDIVGRFTGPDGKTSTYTQPNPGPITTALPFTPRIPASSNCVTYQSSDLFKGATSTMSTTQAAVQTLAVPGAQAGSSSSSGNQASSTSAAPGASQTKTGSASTSAFGGYAGWVLLGLASVAFGGL